MASLQEQLQQLQQHVQWRLKRARIAAIAGVPHARTSVKNTIEQLTRVMQKVHADKSIQVVVDDLPEELYFAGEVQDLQEIIGNILDNAYKWARRQILISGGDSDGKLCLAILDDGPGCLDLTESTHPPHRGQRADESVAGSGLRVTLTLPGGLS